MKLTDNPQLMAEWDFEKNKNLNPQVLALHSHKVAWWKCSKGHSYDMTLHQKAAGAGCPYCSGHRVLAGYNDLKTLFPIVVREWNYAKNKSLVPEKCAAHSNKKVWWICPKGHEYEMAINSRSGGSSCPYCSNHKVLVGFNDFQTSFPKIAEEWDYNKNDGLKPTDIVSKTKRKVWWKCAVCGNEWKTSVIDRVYGTGCPKCSLKKRIASFKVRVLKRNGSLTDPILLKEWSYKKNVNLVPCDITAHSNRKVWWVCSNGHEYQATVDKRSSGQGCPICSNHKLLVGFNDLTTRFPSIALEWDMEKNQGLAPTDVVASTTKKVWWKCSVCGHSWCTDVRHRTGKGAGCPVCGIKKRTQAHKLAFIEKNGCLTDPLLVKEWHQEKNGLLTPEQVSSASNKTVWWKCSKCGYEWRAKIGNRSLLKRGCPACANHVVVVGKNDLATTHPELSKEWHPTKNINLSPSQVTHGTSKKVWWLCPKGHEYQASILHRGHGTACPICNAGRQTSFAEQAVFFYLKQIYPDTINRYKEIFNNGMELDMYIPSIRIGIEYDGMFYHKPAKLQRELKKHHICCQHNIKLIRLREADRRDEHIGEIPYDYSLHVPGVDKSSQALNLLIYRLIELLEYTILLKPRTRSLGIDIDTDRDRYKIRQYMTDLKKDSLYELRPDLAKEWHPTKNGALRPTMFKAGSSVKIWWKCSKCNYEWAIAIGRRVAGTGCPKCGIEKSSAAKRKEIEMLDPNTKEILATFISISDASRKLKINSSNISMVCKGQRPKAGGYCWRYKKKN